MNNKLEELKANNNRLIAKIQEQNSNISLLVTEIKIKNEELKNYKRLYENEKKERQRIYKILNEKQQKFNL